KLVDQKIRRERARCFGGHALRRFGYRESEASTLVSQRFAIAMVELQYFADENDVISALVLECRAALESCDAVFKQRDSVRTTLQCQSGKAIDAAFREMTGQDVLIAGQHMHREMARGQKCLDAGG